MLVTRPDRVRYLSRRHGQRHQQAADPDRRRGRSPADVDMVVDVIRRRRAHYYMCTPASSDPVHQGKPHSRRPAGSTASITSSATSKWSRWRSRSSGLEYAMWFFNSHAGRFADIGDLAYRMKWSTSSRSGPNAGEPNQAVVDKSSPVPPFAEEYIKRPLALEDIKKQPRRPAANRGPRRQSFKLVTYPPDAIREEDRLRSQEGRPGAEAHRARTRPSAPTC